MQNIIKDKSGITLITLVITIVILIILSGITINSTLGQNGIITRAKQAKIDIQIASIKEQVNIEILDKEIEKDGRLSKIELEEILNKYGEIVYDEKENIIGIKTKDGGYDINIKDIIGDIGNLETNNENVDGSTEGSDEELITAIKVNRQMNKGTKETLVVSFEPENIKNVELEWSSSDETVARVDTVGEVTAVQEGTVTITAKVKGGSSIKQMFFITVKETILNGTSTEQNVAHNPQEITDFTWEELEKIAQEISSPSNMNDITKDTYEITVSMDGKENIKLGVGDWKKIRYKNGEEWEEKRVRILGFNHDDLIDTNSYNDGMEHTKAGISFEFVDYIYNKEMNEQSNSTNENGWGESSLQTILNDEIINNIEDSDKIKTVAKKYIQNYNDADYNTENNIGTSNNKLWLLACSEIWQQNTTNTRYGYAVTKEGERYKYYKENLKNISYDTTSSVTMKPSEDNANYWWLRSLSYTSANNFCVATPEGRCYIGANIDKMGVAPRFFDLIIGNIKNDPVKKLRIIEFTYAFSMIFIVIIYNNTTIFILDKIILQPI
ncbi:MAG: Ig-like domain-containing protein [Clostridia bacterium]|nr:Ig-like domain-containing protein [Clostridia bacterium]